MKKFLHIFGRNRSSKRGRGRKRTQIRCGIQATFNLNELSVKGRKWKEIVTGPERPLKGLDYALTGKKL